MFRLSAIVCGRGGSSNPLSADKTFSCSCSNDQADWLGWISSAPLPCLMNSPRGGDGFGVVVADGGTVANEGGGGGGTC